MFEGGGRPAGRDPTEDRGDVALGRKGRRPEAQAAPHHRGCE
ncbi:hypothetical protein AVEN_156032-1, partial [Araneus ventricosus]